MIFAVNEGSHAQYTASLQDIDGRAVPGSSLTDLRLTLYCVKTGEVINGRDHQAVLEAHGVSVAETGTLTWDLSPDDNVVLNQAAPKELHRAVFEASWAGGVRRYVWEIDIRVTNIGKFPS